MPKQKLTVVLRTVIVIVVVFWIYNSFKADIPGGVSMLEDVSSTVTRTDGTVTRNQTYYFGKLNPGDVVEIFVNLPEEKRTIDASLCFFTCHSVVRAWFQDELLYESGAEYAEKGDIIGGVYPVIRVPEDAWGKEICIRLEVKEKNAFYKLSELFLLPTKYFSAYLIGQNVFGFIVSIAGFTIGLILLGIYFINGFDKAQNRKGCYIALFTISMSLWIFSSNGFNTLLSKGHYWITVEYVSIFLVSTPLLFYFHEEPLKTGFKKLCQIKILINVVFVLSAIMLNALNIRHFCDVLLFAHTLLALDAVIFLLFVMKKDVYTEPRNNILMKTGFWLLLFFGVLDIIRYNFAKYFNLTEMEAAFDVLPLGLILFTLCFFMAYLAETHDIEREQQEKIYFKHMAYIDPLTKINNRMKINEVFEQMHKDRIRTFGVVSFDLNKLKETNDHDGHQAGDKLICRFADLLREYAEDGMTIGRVGGDEFIIVASGEQAEKLEMTAEKIRKKAEDESDNLSFSYGIAHSSEENAYPVEEVYKEADRRMYIMKKQMK